MKRFSILSLAFLSLVSCGVKDGRHELHVLCTNDVHGCYFDSTYVGEGARRSLMAVNWYVDSVRNAAGADNVLLLDSGDCLQGDNAAYYYNYVDTLSEHLYVRMASCMGYDAIAVGNHDIETGHAVYDRVYKQLKKKNIAFLAANAVRTSDGKAYFDEYALLRKAGMKVLVLGCTNPNIKGWLGESVWSGMDFESLLPFVQNEVDSLRRALKPQLVVVAVHSGSGKGDGSSLESQGLDLLNSLRGVDLLLTSHDHRPMALSRDSIAYINTGSHARFLGHGTLTVDIEGGKIAAADRKAELIPVDAAKSDPEMRRAFAEDFKAVKAFTLREVGSLSEDLRTRDAYAGMSPYINLVHAVQLAGSKAQISIAAPLTYDGTVKAGTLIYNDMFTIYPFENQLYVVKLRGCEIKDYLEASYDRWIRTYVPGTPVLNIVPRDDPRTGQKSWSFAERAYNFDSAAGLSYTVDITRPTGQRVEISAMADGSAFDMEAFYTVAMTSYRANGGGGLLKEGAGLDSDEVAARTIARLPEIRELLYDFVIGNGTLTPELISDPAVLGTWAFTPTAIAEPAIAADMEKLFR